MTPTREVDPGRAALRVVPADAPDTEQPLGEAEAVEVLDLDEEPTIGSENYIG